MWRFVSLLTAAGSLILVSHSSRPFLVPVVIPKAEFFLPRRWSLKLWSIWWPNTSAAPLRMASPPGLGFLLTLAAAFHLAVTFHHCLSLGHQSGSWRAHRSSPASAILYIPFWWHLESPSLLFHNFLWDREHGDNADASLDMSSGTVWCQRGRLVTGNPRPKNNLGSTWFSFLEKQRGGPYLKCRDNVRKT